MIKPKQQRWFFWACGQGFNKYPLFKNLLSKDFTYTYKDVFFHFCFGNSEYYIFLAFLLLPAQQVKTASSLISASC